MGSETTQNRTAQKAQVDTSVATSVGTVPSLIHKDAKALAEQRAELLYHLNHKTSLGPPSISRANLIMRSAQEKQLLECDKNIKELRSKLESQTNSADIVKNFDQAVSYYQDTKLLKLVSANVANLARDIQDAKGVLGTGDPKIALERYHKYLESLSELLKRNPSFRERLEEVSKKTQQDVIASMEKGSRIAHEIKLYFDGWHLTENQLHESVFKLAPYELKYMRAAFKHETKTELSEVISKRLYGDKFKLVADTKGEKDHVRPYPRTVDISEIPKERLLVKITTDILSNNEVGTNVNNILSAESLPQLLHSLINLSSIPEKSRQEVLSILKQETQGDFVNYLREHNKIIVNKECAEFLRKLTQNSPHNLTSDWNKFLEKQVVDFASGIGKEEAQLNPSRSKINVFNEQLQEIVNLSRYFGVSVDIEQLEKRKLQFVLITQSEEIKSFVAEKYRNPELYQLSKHLDATQQKVLLERTKTEVAAYLEAQKSFIGLFPELKKEISEAEQIGAKEGAALSQKLFTASKGFKKLLDHWEWGNGELISITKGLSEQEFNLLKNNWRRQYGSEFLEDMFAEVGNSSDYKILVCRTEGKIAEALAIEASSHINDADYLEKHILPLLNPENIVAFDQEFNKIAPELSTSYEDGSQYVPYDFTTAVNSKITQKSANVIISIYNLASAKENTFEKLRAEVDYARFFKHYSNSKGEECAKFLNHIATNGSEDYEIIYRNDPKKLQDKLKLDGVNEGGYVDTKRLEAFIDLCGGEKRLNTFFDQEKSRVDITANLNDAQVEWCRSMITSNREGTRNSNKFKEHIISLRYAGHDKYTFGWGTDEDIIKEHFVLNERISANIRSGEQKEFYLGRQKAYNKKFFEVSEFSEEAQKIVKDELDDWDQNLVKDRRIHGELSECGQVCEALGRPNWWNGTNSAVVKSIVLHKNSKQLSEFDKDLQKYLSEMGYQSLVQTYVTDNQQSAAPLLNGWLLEEGEEKVETELLLAGKPETLIQFMKAAEKRYTFYKDNWEVGNYWAGNAEEMEKDYNIFQKYLETTSNDKLKPGTAEWRKMESLYQNFLVSAGQCREDNQIFTERCATTATIVVAVGTSWATAGQSLWLIALVSGGSAFTANALTHLALDRDTYTSEEMLEHLALAGVEGISLGAGTKVGLFFAKKMLIKKALIIVAEKGAMQLSSKGISSLVTQGGLKTGISFSEQGAIKATKELMEDAAIKQLVKNGLLKELVENEAIQLTTKGLDRLANSSYGLSLVNNITQSASGEFLAGNIQGSRLFFTDDKSPTEVMQEMLSGGLQRAGIGTLASFGFTTLFNAPGLLKGKLIAKGTSPEIASALDAPNTTNVRTNTPVKEVSEFELQRMYKKSTGKVAAGEFRGWYDEATDTIHVNKSLSEAEKKGIIAHELRHKWGKLSERQLAKGEDEMLQTVRHVEHRAQFQEEMELRKLGQRRVFHKNGSTSIEQIPESELGIKLSIADKKTIYSNIEEHVRINYPREFLASTTNSRVAAAFVSNERASLIRSFKVLGVLETDSIPTAEGLLNIFDAAIKKCDGNPEQVAILKAHFNKIIGSGILNSSLDPATLAHLNQIGIISPAKITSTAIENAAQRTTKAEVGKISADLNKHRGLFGRLLNNRIRFFFSDPELFYKNVTLEVKNATDIQVKINTARTKISDLNVLSKDPVRLGSFTDVNHVLPTLSQVEFNKLTPKGLQSLIAQTKKGIAKELSIELNSGNKWYSRYYSRVANSFRKPEAIVEGLKKSNDKNIYLKINTTLLGDVTVAVNKINFSLQEIRNRIVAKCTTKSDYNSFPGLFSLSGLLNFDGTALPLTTILWDKIPFFGTVFGKSKLRVAISNNSVRAINSNNVDNIISLSGANLGLGIKTLKEIDPLAVKAAAVNKALEGSGQADIGLIAALRTNAHVHQPDLEECIKKLKINPDRSRGYAHIPFIPLIKKIPIPLWSIKRKIPLNYQEIIKAEEIAIAKAKARLTGTKLNDEINKITYISRQARTLVNNADLQISSAESYLLNRSLSRTAENLHDRMIEACDTLGYSCHGSPFTAFTPAKLNPSLIRSKFAAIKNDIVNRFIKDSERVQGGVFKKVLNNSTTAAERKQLDDCLIALGLKLDDGGRSLDNCKPTYKEIKAAQAAAEKKARIRLLGPKLDEELNKIRHISGKIDEIATNANPKLAAAALARKDLLDLCQQFPRKAGLGVTTWELTKKATYYSTYPILHPFKAIDSVFKFVMVRGWQALWILPPKTGTMLSQVSETLGDFFTRRGFSYGSRTCYSASLVFKKNGVIGCILKLPFTPIINLPVIHRVKPWLNKILYEGPVRFLATKSASLESKGYLWSAKTIKSYAQSINDSGYILTTLKFPFKLVLVDLPVYFKLDVPGTWVIKTSKNIGNTIYRYPIDKLQSISTNLSTSNNRVTKWFANKIGIAANTIEKGGYIKSAFVIPVRTVFWDLTGEHLYNLLFKNRFIKDYFRERRILNGKREFAKEFGSNDNAYSPIFKKLKDLGLSLDNFRVPRVHELTTRQYAKEVAIWFFVSPAILFLGAELLLMFPLSWLAKTDLFSSMLRGSGVKIPEEEESSKKSYLKTFLETAAELPAQATKRIAQFYTGPEFYNVRLWPYKFSYDLATDKKVREEAKEVVKETMTHGEVVGKAIFETDPKEMTHERRQEILDRIERDNPKPEAPSQEQDDKPSTNLFNENKSKLNIEQDNGKHEEIEDQNGNRFMVPRKVKPEDLESRLDNEELDKIKVRKSLYSAILPKPIINKLIS